MWVPAAAGMDPSLPELIAEGDEQHVDTPYSLRQEWVDVTPVDPDAGLPAVVSIQYEPRDKEVLTYFHAVLQSGELSERVLALTEEVGGCTFAQRTLHVFHCDDCSSRCSTHLARSGSAQPVKMWPPV